MKFEIVDAYLLKLSKDEKPKGWSLHVYFPELDMDIRGIQLLRYSQDWFLMMPYLNNWDPEQQKMIRFPMMNFLDNEKNKELKEEIKKEAIKIVQQKIIEITEKEIEIAKKYKKKPKQEKAKKEKKND